MSKKGKFLRKFTSSEKPSLSDLDFATASLPPIAPAAVATLTSLNFHTPVSIVEVDPGGEWFRLKTGDYSDSQLFSMLREDWASIVGANVLSFALIHCTKEPKSGVWVHFRTPWKTHSKFSPGCHQVDSLS